MNLTNGDRVSKCRVRKKYRGFGVVKWNEVGNGVKMRNRVAKSRTNEDSERRIYEYQRNHKRNRERTKQAQTILSDKECA